MGVWPVTCNTQSNGQNLSIHMMVGDSCESQGWCPAIKQPHRTGTGVAAGVVPRLQYGWWREGRGFQAAGTKKIK